MGTNRSLLASLKRGARQASRTRKHKRALVVENLEERRVPSQALQPVLTIPAATVSNLINGPDGNLWVGVNRVAFSGAKPPVMERIGLNGSVAAFPVPVPAGATDFQILSIATGPDRNIWFDAQLSSGPTGEVQQAVLGKVTPTGQVTEFPPIPVPAGFTALSAKIINGPGGALWFNYWLTPNTLNDLRGIDFIGRVSPSGALSFFPTTTFSTNAGVPFSLAAGSDGDLWFTNFTGNPAGDQFARMSPAGVVTPIPVQKLSLAAVNNALNGNLVLTAETFNFRRQVFKVSTAGVLTPCRIPNAISSAFSGYLGSGAGSLWFTNVFGPNQLGRITANGVVTSYKLSKIIPRSDTSLDSMAVGNDGNLYLLNDPDLGPTATLYRLSPSKLPAVRPGRSITLR